MGIGSIIVGLALTLVVGAYLSRPFRTAARETDLDPLIEAWVRHAREEQAAPPPHPDAGEAEINYCPQCGRRVSPEDRFCARCGTPLEGA
jgi:hypothetical protein